MRWLLGMVAHGLIHAIWLAPATKDAPFDVRHSRLFGDLGAFATSTGVLAGLGLLVAGGAYLFDVSGWPIVLAAAVAISAALLLLPFTKWLFALAINLGLVAVAVRGLLNT
jgi:hypothetical protein